MGMLSTIEARIFVKRTIGQLLFDGYEDTVMDIGSSLDSEDEYFEYEEEEQEEDPNKVPMDKFGWFYKRNGTSWSDGDLTMHTGSQDLSNLGKISSWNHLTRTGAYQGECGMVRGSADGLFPPGLTSNTDSISIFSTDHDSSFWVEPKSSIPLKVEMRLQLN